MLPQDVFAQRQVRFGWILHNIPPRAQNAPHRESCGQNNLPAKESLRAPTPCISPGLNDASMNEGHLPKAPPLSASSKHARDSASRHNTTNRTASHQRNAERPPQPAQKAGRLNRHSPIPASIPKLLLRHRIRQSKRQKLRHLPLLPMRQAPAMHANLLPWMQKTNWQVPKHHKEEGFSTPTASRFCESHKREG